MSYSRFPKRRALGALSLLLAAASSAGAWSILKGHTDTTAPAKVTIPAGGCRGTTAVSNWDLPATTPAVAACLTGTNIQKGVLDFVDTAGGTSAQFTMTLPAEWTTNQLPDVALTWMTTAITGNVKWTVQFVCTDVAATATDDPAFPASGAGFNTATTVVAGTASRLQTSAITAATLPSSCVTGTRELLHIRVFRDGADAADTSSATVRLVALDLIFYQTI